MARRRRGRRTTRLPMPLVYATLALILLSVFWKAILLAALIGGPLLAAAGTWLHVRRRRQLAAARAYQAWLDQQVATTNAMTAGEFEELIARLLVRDGHMQVRVVGGRGDLGADVVGVDPSGRRVVVQCKHYLGGQPVTSGDVQRFLGTVWAEHRADIGMFVTTSRFTTDALALGQRRGLHMVDRATLAAWMARHAATPATEATGATTLGHAADGSAGPPG